MAELKAKEYMCFEDIKHMTDEGVEFWLARELAPVLDYAQGDHKARLRERMEAFIHTMDVRIGASDCFDDLYSARLYFTQASAALNNGSLFEPKERYFQFQDYALTELVVNSLGDLPAEMFYSDGLRRLVSHDLDASVSYIDTLRVYLEHNMSVTQTAAALYIHRSTLLERLARVERELGTDLKDPDERLRLLILLKSMQLHESISGKREA